MFDSLNPQSSTLLGITYKIILLQIDMINGHLFLDYDTQLVILFFFRYNIHSEKKKNTGSQS